MKVNLSILMKRFSILPTERLSFSEKGTFVVFACVVPTSKNEFNIRSVKY